MFGKIACCIFAFVILLSCNDEKSKEEDAKSMAGIDSIADLRKLLPDSLKKGAIALVIGQSNYQNVRKLTYAHLDADSIAEALSSFGIRVLKLIDADKETFIKGLDTWRKELPNYSVGLLYYSGHGMEVNGNNYLIPVNFPDDIRMNTMQESIALDTITDILAQANTKMNLVILDACRDNPFSTKSMKTGGLAFANVPVGTFIGFAASPGHVSYDEGNTNSVYTEGILKFIRVPDVTIDHIFNNVNAYVREHTGGKQVPFKNSSLDGDFYFNFSKNSSDTKNLNLENKTAYSEAIKALFPQISFGSSVGDVLSAEFGESYRNSFAFKDMPVSGECTNNEIRYYWRSLEESQAFDKVKTYLYYNSLDTMISMKESAIFYTFKDSKLFRMQVTFKFKNVNFYRQLMNTLNIKDIKFWGKFFDYNDKYFTIAELDDTYNRSSLMLGDANSYNFCNADWFSRADTINASIK